MRKLLYASALTLAACASPLTYEDIRQEHRDPLNTVSEDYRSFTSLEEKLGTESAPTEPQFLYDSDEVKGSLIGQDVDTLDRVIQAYSFMHQLDEKNLKPQMLANYLAEATNDDLSKTFVGYDISIANSGFNYLNSINAKLQDGQLEDKVKTLEQSVERLPENEKSTLVEILNNFKTESAELRDFSRFLTMVGRATGKYEHNVLTNYASLAKVLGNGDLYAHGEELAKQRNVQLNFEDCRTQYDLIRKTHQARNLAFEDYTNSKLSMEDLEALNWYTIMQESKNHRSAVEKGGLEWDDAIPIWNLFKTMTKRVSQFGGHEGFGLKNEEDAKQAYQLVVAHDFGITYPVNIYANENRANAAITVLINGGYFLIGKAASGGFSGGSSSSGSGSGATGGVPAVIPTPAGPVGEGVGGLGGN